MSYIGKWKFDSAIVRDDDMNIVYQKADEYLNSPIQFAEELSEEEKEDEMKERRRLITSSLEVLEDGTFYVLYELPEGFTEEDAKAEGLIVRNGKFTDKPLKYEVKDGKLWVDLGEAGGNCDLSDSEDYIDFFIARYVKE